MNPTFPLRTLALATLSLGMAAPTLGQDVPHNYGGLSLGRSSTSVDAAGITAGMVPGLATTGSTIDRSGSAYRLFGGHQFSRTLAVEGGYFNLGSHGFGATTSPAGTLAGRTKVHGVHLDLVGAWPVTERFSALGRIGVQHAWSRSSFSGTGAAAGVSPSGKHNGTNLKVGLGVQYAFSPSMWLRGEIERYRIRGAAGQRQNVNVASVSLVFPFGQTSAPRTSAAPTYVPQPPMPPVAVAPPPAPVAPAPVAMPAAPAPPDVPVQRVNLSADALFGFDQSTVRPEARGALDGLSQQLRGVNYDTVRVQGHTDRLGSNAYNQTLSAERAESVKSYLVRQGQMDASRISATGLGASQPVTQPADCSDRMARTQLIACLQPDRRVEVEVMGTR